MDEATDRDKAPDPRDLSANPFKQVHIEIRVSVGRARPTVAELLSLEQHSVLNLDSTISDPVEIYAGDRLIARGELEELEGSDAGRLAVRLTEIGVIDDSL